MDETIKLLIILAVGLVTLILLRLISGKRKRLHVRFICNLLKVLVVVGCLVAILNVYTDLEKLAAALLTGGGLILAILSFAAQKVLNNILSGISISFSRPFDLGDKIKVMNGNTPIAEGTVSDITLRHTVIMTYDGQSCIIPNGTMNESMLVNVSAREKIGNFLEITVGFDTDFDLALKLTEEIVRGTENVIDCTKPLISRFEADGPVIKTTVWTKNVAENFVACGSIRKKLIEAFRDNNITIPYQTITIESIPESSGGERAKNQVKNQENDPGRRRKNHPGNAERK
ncbi:MAG: mechanosensitive ion channel family protein [Lachnospiraceae bacterium]|nr:mechanosensitive ion channel family protein [Lachnospiraceae bacterium]